MVKDKKEKINEMAKSTIRLNDTQLRKMIAESVKKALKEGYALDRGYNGLNYARDARAEGVQEISDWHDEQWNEISNMLLNCAQKLDTIDPTDYGSWTDEVDRFITRASNAMSNIQTGIDKIVQDRDLDGLDNV